MQFQIVRKVSKEDVGEGGRQVGEAGQGGHRRGEGPQEGLLPGARVCLWVVSISPRAGGEWHLEGLSPLPGGRLGSWRRPPPLLEAPPDSPLQPHFPTCLAHPVPHTWVPWDGPVASPTQAPRQRHLCCSSRWVQRADRVLWGRGGGHSKRGWEIPLHFLSPPHLSGPFQASVHGVSMLLSNWVQKNGGKSR